MCFPFFRIGCSKQTATETIHLAMYECVLQCGASCLSSDTITEGKWSKLQQKAESWVGLDKFGTIFKDTLWENGPLGFYMHNSCYITVCSNRSLDQAKNRKEKEGLIRPSQDQVDEAVEEDSCQSPEPKRLRSSIDGPLSCKDKCVWCRKGPDKKHPNRKTPKLLRISTLSGWRQFKRHTVLVEDEEIRARLSKIVESTEALSDPFAADIMYHHLCWMEYVANNNKFDQDKAVHIQNVTYLEMKHIFLRKVDNIIFIEHEIRSLQSLLLEYKNVASEHGFLVGNIKSSFVKELLIKEYGDKIGFYERNQKNRSELVYDTQGGGSYVEAALNSCGISDEQLISNLAPRLREKIKETDVVDWPPTVDQLEDEEDLCELITTLFSTLKKTRGHKQMLDENPVLRTLASLITYFVTGKRTITATRIAVLVHGITRSRELIDILHKCGVCISYNDLLILYMSWGLSDAESSNSCPSGIAKYKPPIVIVDNDDFKIDTLTGSASCAHRTNVLYVQPESYEEKEDLEASIEIDKKKMAKDLTEKCKNLTKVEPYVYPLGADKEPPVRAIVEKPQNGTRPQRVRSIIHVLARTDPSGERPSPENQTVPSYSGMQSCLLPHTSKSKPYYHVTYNEPPKKSVMNDIMEKLTKTMVEKFMPYAFLVGDLPTYKLIVEIKAENPTKYSNIVPVIGAFHQQMSFIHAIYKRFLGSGISDLLVSAGVIVEGSVDQALKGGHYRRGLRCIMLWRETLIYKRLKTILSYDSLSHSIKENLTILRKALEETKENLSSAYNNLEDDNDLQNLVDAVYEEPGTDMGGYWLSYMEMSDVLLQNVHACHVGNFEEYVSSTYDMLPCLLAYNNHDYGRWLPDYWAMISSLPTEQKEYLTKHFAQSMTGLPYSCQPMDLWIEVTMNLNSKLKQGWLQLLQNEKQLFCTIRNANNVAKVKTFMKNDLKCERRDQRHVECQPARMRKDEQSLQDILACLNDFQADPFDDADPMLRSLQSGVAASAEIVQDLQNALQEGQNQLDNILQNRVFSKDFSLRATISKNKRLNLASTPVLIATGSKRSVEEMEKHGLATLVELIEKNNLIELEVLLEGRITEECLAMFNVDGSMRKTAKSKLLQSFSREPVQHIEQPSICLVDMGLIWRLATPISDDRDIKTRCGRDYLWKDYLDKVCSMVFSRHTNAEKLILINDVYTGSSIKDDEHDRRAAKETNLPNVYPKELDVFPTSKQFKKIMLKSENKTRLQKILRGRFQARVNDVDSEVIYCEGDKAVNLTNGNIENDFVFSHSEADTMLISAYAKLRESYDGSVIIDSEDTDVYVQGAFVSHVLPGNLYMKNKKLLFNCAEMLPGHIAKVVVPFHIITGCDHNSGFFGRGKKSLFEKLKKDRQAQELLQEVGESLTLEDSVRLNMKRFVLWKMYGENTDSCAKARASKWKKLKKKSMTRLPPDEDTLNHHLDRTNYLAYCLKHFELVEHPPPIRHGWEMVNGRCRPIRHTALAISEINRTEISVTTDSDDESSTEYEYGESSNDESDED